MIHTTRGPAQQQSCCHVAPVARGGWPEAVRASRNIHYVELLRRVIPCRQIAFVRSPYSDLYRPERPALRVQRELSCETEL